MRLTVSGDMPTSAAICLIGPITTRFFSRSGVDLARLLQQH